MKDLVVRLSALDPDAGAAVRVIAYFDQLVDARAGLATIVRGAAVLAGCPARLADRERGVDIRVGPDGRRGDAGGLPDPSWPSTPVAAGGSAVLWLERPGPAGPVEAMVLERAAAAARAVLDRTRGRAPAQTDEAAVEVLIDQGAPPEARRHAARSLGLPESGLARAVALEGGGARIAPATTADRAQGPWNPGPGTRGRCQRAAGGRRDRRSRAQPAGVVGRGADGPAADRRGHRRRPGAAGRPRRRGGRPGPAGRQRRGPASSSRGERGLADWRWERGVC